MQLLTEKKWSFLALKVSWIYSLSGLLLFVTVREAAAQVSLVQISTRPAVAMSADSYDRLITADETGTITAYDTAGVKVNEYSPRIVSNVSSLEARRSMQILVFYRDLQQYTLLDRFLTPLSGYPYPARLPSEQIGFARQMAFAYDDQFWIFDETDFSLKKYDARLQVVSSTIPMSLIVHQKEYQITHIREYQNQLFVCDRNSGILLFDNLGNYRKTLPFKDLSTLQFYNNELYLTQGSAIHFYNIYTQTERQIQLPCHGTLSVVLKNHIFISNPRGIFLYTLP